jgi:uncharacterized protein (TIGR02145 family)
MAENLNYDTEGSVCYNNDGTNCETYGRLYTWAMAMNFDASCNSSLCSENINSKHIGVCPEGWHIPSQAEWEELSNFVGSDSKHLKSQEGWDSCGPSGSGKRYLCEDTYGFAALPGGNNTSVGSLVGISGNWWTASEAEGSSAGLRYMDYNNGSIGGFTHNKDILRSVRCLQDD